jgi:hypothetical protein
MVSAICLFRVHNAIMVHGANTVEQQNHDSEKKFSLWDEAISNVLTNHDCVCPTMQDGIENPQKEYSD